MKVISCAIVLSALACGSAEEDLSFLAEPIVEAPAQDGAGDVAHEGAEVDKIYRNGSSFPGRSPGEFAPWIDAGMAERAGRTREAMAEELVGSCRKKLADFELGPQAVLAARTNDARGSAPVAEWAGDGLEGGGQRPSMVSIPRNTASSFCGGRRPVGSRR